MSVSRSSLPPVIGGICFIPSSLIEGTSGGSKGVGDICGGSEVGGGGEAGGGDGGAATAAAARATAAAARATAAAARMLTAVGWAAAAMEQRLLAQRRWEDQLSRP